MSSQAEATINHFSHPHPLHLSNRQNYLIPALCSGCKLEATGLIYSCSICNYFLHIKCSKMPKKITHPFHKDHVFTLQPKPRYAEGVFRCDACGGQDEGFSYHCKICNIDLHILCAALPLSIRHQSHNIHHQLNLIFSPPYPNKIFNCDICNNPGSDHWLYRCEICSFDVHLDCRNIPAAPILRESPRVTSIPQAQAGFPGTNSRSPIQVPQVPYHQAFRPQYTAAGIPLHNLMPHMNNAINQGIQAPVRPLGPRQNINHDLMVLQFLQGLNNNSSQNIYSQYFLQTLAAAAGVGGAGVGSGFGGTGVGVGGAGGDLAGLQQLYQAFSGMSASGIGGYGGGVGGAGSGLDGLQQLYQLFSGITAGGSGGIGGVPGMDFLGSTVGAGQNIFPALMGGGGEQLNVLQSLMGGDGGSSILNGGLDALIGLLGGFSL